MKKKPVTNKKKSALKDLGKTRKLFSIDEGIFLEFRRHCRTNGVKMSHIIQEAMHQYNIQFANT
jgi:hypothetical protein